VNEIQDAGVSIDRPAEKGCGDQPYVEPFPRLPGFQMELVLLALIISAIIGIAWRRRG
jgi:hypothetical protein